MIGRYQTRCHTLKGQQSSNKRRQRGHPRTHKYRRCVAQRETRFQKRLRRKRLRMLNPRLTGLGLGDLGCLPGSSGAGSVDLQILEALWLAHQAQKDLGRLLRNWGIKTELLDSAIRDKKDQDHHRHMALKDVRVRNRGVFHGTGPTRQPPR